MIIDKTKLIQIDEHMDVNGSWSNTSGQFPAFLDYENMLWYDDDEARPEKIKYFRLLKSYSNKEWSKYDFILIVLEQEGHEDQELLYRVPQGLIPRKESKNHLLRAKEHFGKYVKENGSKD
jgi:hypothetical protein